MEELAAAGEHDMCGLVSRPREQNLLEALHRSGEIARAVGGEAALVECSPGRRLGSSLGNAEQFVDRQSALAAIDHEPVKLAHDDTVAGESARLLADDDVGA